MAAAAFSGAIAALLVSDALGRLLAAALRISLPRTTRFLTGAALLHLVVFFLGITRYLSAASLGAAGALLVLAAWLVPSPPPAVTVRWPRWLWLILAPYGAVYLAHAAAPEISPDGLAYHVALPQRYLRDGALSFVPFNMYAQLTQAMEMLFTYALAFGRSSSAALVHLAFLFALLGGLWQLQPRAAALVLVCCAPVIGIDAASAYTDVALAAVLVGLVHAARTGDPRVAGLLAGFAFAIKYTGFLALPYALWVTRGNWRVIPPAALMAVPWLVRNFINTGNPVAPFANAWFPNQVFDPALESAYVQSMRAYAGFTGWTSWPLEVTTRGFVLAGLLGPVFLLAPLALRRPRWLATGLFFALPYLSNIGTRFLIPAVPFVSLALVRSLGWLALPVAILHAVLCWPWVAGVYAHPQAWRIKEFAWPLASEAEFYARHLREWPMAAALDRVPKGERVLAFSQFPDALTTADLVTAPLSRPGVELRQAVWYTQAQQFLPTARRRFWLPGPPVQRVRLRASTSIAEIQCFRLFEPVTVVASPPEAADGTVLSRSLPDIWVQVEAAQPFDRLDLVLPAQPDVRVEFQPPVTALEVESSPPVLHEDLIASAVKLLKQRGIRYLLLQDRDYGPALGDLRSPGQNMAGWPVRLVESGQGLWLYRIESPGPD